MVSGEEALRKMSRASRFRNRLKDAVSLLSEVSKLSIKVQAS
jgi:hypothetical protein